MYNVSTLIDEYVFVSSLVKYLPSLFEKRDFHVPSSYLNLMGRPTSFPTYKTTVIPNLITKFKISTFFAYHDPLFIFYFI